MERKETSRHLLEKSSMNWLSKSCEITRVVIIKGSLVVEFSFFEILEGSKIYLLYFDLFVTTQNIYILHV